VRQQADDDLTTSISLGQEIVDTFSRLVGIFEWLDFSTNRPGEDPPTLNGAGAFSEECSNFHARWRNLANRKLAELNAIAQQMATMQRLGRMETKCHCKTLEMCGKGILQSGVSTVERPPLPSPMRLSNLR
jgi:hypothetical protein